MSLININKKNIIETLTLLMGEIGIDEAALTGSIEDLDETNGYRAFGYNVTLANKGAKETVLDLETFYLGVMAGIALAYGSDSSDCKKTLKDLTRKSS
jgi:hypothetical protein